MFLEEEEIDYSIVICTYNPDERILERCLDAVAKFDLDNLKIEVILVDNNSKIKVKDLPFIKKYTEVIRSINILHVAQQGVQHARIEAIKKSRGKYIVYIDYDNEPSADYLQQLAILNKQYPQVAAWGPGHVSVDFIDGISTEIENYARAALQERHEQQLFFADAEEWQPCYPFGTGLCTYSSILKEYVTLAELGKFTLPGREGNKLTSGEDTQMVLLCISKGYSAGVSPTLKLKHVIPGSRTSKQYFKRLTYGTGISYETCMLQVFPQQEKRLQQTIMPAGKFARKAVKKFIRAKLSFKPFKTFELVSFIASNAGVYVALGKPLPPIVEKMIKYLHVD